MLIRNILHVQTLCGISPSSGTEGERLIICTTCLQVENQEDKVAFELQLYIDKWNTKHIALRHTLPKDVDLITWVLCAQYILEVTHVKSTS